MVCGFEKVTLAENNVKAINLTPFSTSTFQLNLDDIFKLSYAGCPINSYSLIGFSNYKKIWIEGNLLKI
jgi:hypothetical protein